MNAFTKHKVTTLIDCMKAGMTPQQIIIRFNWSELTLKTLIRKIPEITEKEV